MKHNACFSAVVATLFSLIFIGNSPDAAVLPDVTGMERYYIRYAPAARQSLAGDISTRGGYILYDLRSIDTYSVALPPAAVTRFSSTRDARVKLLEPVPVHRIIGSAAPATTRAPTNPQVVPWNIDQFQARDVWDTDRDGNLDPGAPTGTGVTVCIIDTGFFQPHDDFQGLAVSGESQIPGEAWSEDGYGHGTHVAGTINASYSNGIGVSGVLPGTATLYIVKAFDNSAVWTDTSDLAAAAASCRDHGADVISMSLVGDFSATENTLFQSLYDTHGILNVAAAGNNGDDANAYPANFDSVVSVGALYRDETAAGLSQWPATGYDPDNPPGNAHWDVTELSGGGITVLSTIPSPDRDVPVYQVTVDNVIYAGQSVQGSGAGSLSATLVAGGFCDTGDISPQWSDKVVLCERGVISVADKINNVGNNGGLAALIYNDEAGSFSASCGGACTSAIPALSLSRADGQFLQLNNLGMIASVMVDDGSACVDCTGGYGYSSGTSMATPGVAAGAALILNACNGSTGISNTELRQLLRDSAKDLSGVHSNAGAYGTGYDQVTGWGLVQLKAALDLGASRFGAAVCSPEPALDFGDAPDPSYPTLLASNGARHLATGPLLGSNRDDEADGQPSENGDGDDTVGVPDDEDGVSFTGALVPGQTASVDVTASAPALINAWIDFNNNNDWSDTGEQILTDVPVVAGINNLNFPVPAAAAGGTGSFARFRLNTAGGLTATGLANDGEVEDLAVYIEEPDADDDGVPDQQDNCPLIGNPSQLDANSDDIGNVCDPQNLCADPNTVLQNQSYDSNFYCAAEESIIAGGVDPDAVTVATTGHVVFTAPAIELVALFNVVEGGLFAAGANLVGPCDSAVFDAAADMARNQGGLLFYEAQSSLDEPNDRLQIELLSPSAGSFVLTGENYSTCQECILVHTDCTAASCGKTFLASRGQLDVTSVSPLFSGSLTDASLVEVTIDPGTFVSTPVVAGEKYCIPSYVFSAAITP